MTDTHLGLIATAVPALIVGLILLGRYKPVLWMYIGAMAIGLGYLTVQGTVADIGQEVRAYLPSEKVVEPAAAPEPAPAVAPTPDPAPAAAPAPSETPPASPAPEPEPATP